MSMPTLPTETSEVLKIPKAEIPSVIQGLVRRRALSDLVKTVHRDMKSADPAIQRQAHLALSRLGFPEA